MKTEYLLFSLVIALAGSGLAQAERISKPVPTHANVSYGKHDRNVLDFWQAEGDGPRPLLVYIHGGGWEKGDKRAMRNAADYVQKGISVAAINYRHTPANPLPAPVHDAARAIQFLRSKAAVWNIDKNNVVLGGGSAGGCSALWIACHDDLANPRSKDPVERESTRVQGAGVLSAQTCIDPKVIEPWIGPNVFLSMIYRAVGEPSIESALKNYDKHEATYKEFSAINHLSADDPPVFLEYPDKPEFMILPATRFNYGIHHGLFGIKFKEQSAKVGHKQVELYIKDHDESKTYSNADDFIIKTLLAKGTASEGGSAVVDGDQVSTVIPVPSRLKKFMPKRHLAKLEQAKNEQIDLVMIGDSITHNWERMANYTATFEGRNVLNLGFAGDRTQNVLWRIQHGALDGITPKLVTLMISTNHMHLPKKGYVPDCAEDIIIGIKAILAELRTRLPESKLLLFSVFPRRAGAENDRVNAVNALLPSLADGQQVSYQDIHDIFLTESGELNKALYRRDLLHLSDKGYEVWAEALLPIMDANLK